MVSLDNPVRVIDSFVDSLDMNKLGFQKSKPTQAGRPAYDPRDLLKLYIYGYFDKIRSSRKLMQECSRNIELFFLLNRLSLDLRTMQTLERIMPTPYGTYFWNLLSSALALTFTVGSYPQWTVLSSVQSMAINGCIREKCGALLYHS